MTEQTGLFDSRKVKALFVNVRFMVLQSADSLHLFSEREENLKNFETLYKEAL